MTDFYRLGEESDPEMSPVMWEAWLSGIEGRAAPVVRSLAEKSLEDLDLNEQLALYTFIASFHTRSRGHTERLRQLRVEGQRATIAAAPDKYLRNRLIDRGLDAGPAAVASLRADLIAQVGDFKSTQLTRTEELAFAAEAAASIAALLFMRKNTVLISQRPLLTCDEPLIELQPDMALHSLHSAGVWGAPFLLFPLGPRQVLVSARIDLPWSFTDRTLTARETLDVNSVVAGNADRLVVAEREVRLAERLYIPTTRARPKAGAVASSEDSSLIHVHTTRRWHGDPHAPQHPIGRLWPRVIPPAPPIPPDIERALARLRAN